MPSYYRATGVSAALPAFRYRKPALQYTTANQVTAENNTANAGETTILFPDGEVRTTSGTTTNRVLDLTQTANWTSADLTGIRSGGRVVNTWYAVYAVKSRFSGGFVLVADTVTPVQASLSTLDTNFGANAWVYLGLIRNGDNAGNTNVILQFVQSGQETDFSVPTNGHIPGITLVTMGAGNPPFTWAYAAGTGAAQIPSHINIGNFGYDLASATAKTGSTIGDSATLARYAAITAGAAVAETVTVHASILQGINVSGDGSSWNGTVQFYGWIDPYV